MNVISGKTIGMTREWSKIMLILSVAVHQVVKNLSEPPEIMVEHLRQKDPKLDSWAVRALLTRGGPRLMKVDGHYSEVYLHGTYQILTNVDGISNYTKAYVTDASGQVGRIYIGREKFRVRRIENNAMLEQNTFHIGCEADVAEHLIDVQGRQLSVKGLLDTEAVVSVTPVSTCLTWASIGWIRLRLISNWQRLIRMQKLLRCS